MPPALSDDLLWRIVWKYDLDGLKPNTIAKDLRVCRRKVYSTLRDWKTSNYTDVKLNRTRYGSGRAPPMLERHAETLLKILLEHPEGLITEATERFRDETGLNVHYSTILRAARQLGYSRKKLRRFARKRDAEAALEFKAFLVAHFDPEQLFFLDETAKDRRAMFRDYGWALRGTTPIDRRMGAGRGPRVSSLCGFDIKGFVNWYTIEGTFNRDAFIEAVKATVVRPACHMHVVARCMSDGHSHLAQLPHIKPFPGKRSVVILDNAKIHHTHEFVRLVNEAGGMVLYTPPYCFDCTPLDNGAFGMVRRYLQKDSAQHPLSDMPLAHALDFAFKSVRPSGARYCFRNCELL